MAKLINSGYIEKSPPLLQRLLSPRLAELLYIIIELVEVVFNVSLRLLDLHHIQLHSQLFIGAFFPILRIGKLRLRPTRRVGRKHFRRSPGDLHTVIQTGFALKSNFGSLRYGIGLLDITFSVKFVPGYDRRQRSGVYGMNQLHDVVHGGTHHLHNELLYNLIVVSYLDGGVDREVL